MDILNEYYPLYPENPDDFSSDEDRDYIVNQLSEKRTKPLIFDDFCMIHSDDLWYMWCIIQEFVDTNSLNLLDRMDYAKFCSMCYENSTKF